MSNKTINKAKLKADMFLEVHFDEHLPNDVINNIKRESNAPVHNDMVEAFRKLDVHLAAICEELPAEDILRSLERGKSEVAAAIVNEDGKEIAKNLFGEADPEADPVDNFLVTGFVLTRKGDDDAVMLIGRKTLSNGELVNLLSPSTKIDRDNYRHAADLAEAIEHCKYEILEFLENGKVAPDKQQEIDFEGPSEEDAVFS